MLKHYKLGGKKGLNTIVKGLSLFWLICKPNRIMTDLDYNSLKNVSPKTYTEQKEKSFTEECQIINVEVMMQLVN